MDGGLISTRYAKALLDFADKKKQADTVYEEALLYTRLYHKHKQLRTVLTNPMLQKKEKRTVILTAAGGVKVSSSFESFVDLVLSKERETDLFAILLKYIDIYRQKNNIHFAKLSTVEELDKKTEDRIVSLIKQTIGGTIELEKVISPELLGGFTIEVDSNRWDASIASQLREIRKTFMDKNMKSI